MSIAIIGDCHGDNYYTNIRNACKLNPNYIICCGDFGYLWEDTKKIRKTLDYISKSFKPIILFVDGNHENFDMLKGLKNVDMFGSVVGKVTDKILHLQRGKIYNIDNRTFFTFGGAYSIDRKFRTEGKSWWREELPNKSEKELARLNIKLTKKVDYIITHAAPTRDVYELGFNLVNDEVSDFLTEVEITLEYREWFFGHYHMDTRIGNKYCLYNKVILLD